MLSLADFERYLLIDQGLRATTVKGYIDDSVQFINWLTNVRHKKVIDATRDDINSYKEFLLEEKKMTKRTINKKLSSLKRLYGFLEEKEVMKENPCKWIEMFKVRNNNVPKIIDEEEVIRIIQSIDTSTPIGVRDKTIVTLVYATGIRRGDLIGLMVDDIKNEYSELYIREEIAKGGRSRFIPIVSEPVKRLLKEYIEVTRPILLGDGQDQGYLFFSGKDNTPLYPSFIDKLYKRVEKNSGTEENLHPHLFRHSIATHLLENNEELDTIQKMLGHASIATTEIYLHAKREHYIKQLKKTHPLNKV